MVRNVRNFWLDASINGRESSLSGGPQAKDGGFDLRILQRDDGQITEAAYIRGTAHSDGTLSLGIYGRDSNRALYELVTTR